MDTLPVISLRRTRHSIPKSFLRLALSLSLMLLAATRGAAQYGGGGTSGSSGTPGYTPPRGGYGSGKAIGIGVGAAAAAGVLFLVLHHHGTVTGCVQPSDDGLRLLDEKKDKSYVLVTGPVNLKPGQRVVLKGQKSKNEAGAQTLEVRNLVKELGVCASPVAHTQPPATEAIIVPE
jgi:hypothetical protein